MVTTAKQSKPGGKGTTKGKAKGINVDLLGPIDKTYLCQKICAAKKSPMKVVRRASKLGYFFSPQRMVDAMIMLDYHLFKGKWRYVPEVSFDMRHQPPKPILAKEQLFPPNYPYWGYPRKASRRPDVIIIDGENSHSLEQAHIIRVIEIKFGKDSLKPRQLASYEKIAGNPKNVTVITDNDCDCDNEEEKGKKVYEEAPEIAPDKVVDTMDELLKGLKGHKLPIYAPVPLPPVVHPKPKPHTPKPATPSRSPRRPVGVPANAHPVVNRQTGRWEWVVPTLQVVGAVVVAAVVVVAIVTGVAEVAAVAVVLTEFAVAGAEVLAARYGVAALARLAF